MTSKGRTQDIVVVGPMCPFGKWALDLVLEIGGQAHTLGHVDARWVGLGDDVASVGSNAGKRQLIVTPEPNAALVEIIRRRDVIVVAILEDPLDILEYNRAISPGEPANNLRALSLTSTINLALRSNRNILFVFRDPSLMARDVATRLLEHLDLPLPAEIAGRIIDKFAGSPSDGLSLEKAIARHSEHYKPPVRAGTDLEADPIAHAVVQAFDPLLKMAWGAPVEKVVWSSWMFIEETSRKSIGPRMLDLTGPARPLYCGPFWSLPPGMYRASIGIDVDAAAVGIRFAIELYWGSGGDKLNCRRLIQPEVAGRQFGSFDVRIDRPDEAVDVRLKLLEPCLEGQISLIEIEFLFISDLDSTPAASPAE